MSCESRKGNDNLCVGDAITKETCTGHWRVDIQRCTFPHLGKLKHSPSPATPSTASLSRSRSSVLCSLFFSISLTLTPNITTSGQDICGEQGHTFYSCKSLSLTECEACYSGDPSCPTSQFILQCHIVPRQDCTSKQECGEIGGSCDDSQLYQGRLSLFLFLFVYFFSNPFDLLLFQLLDAPLTILVLVSSHTEVRVGQVLFQSVSSER
jgi:hypothetical protein